MSTYASKTTVGVATSRAEIEKVITRYGATHFGFVSAPESVSVAFRVDNRQVRFTIHMPTGTEREVTHTPTGLVRSRTAREQTLEQLRRQRWRALVLIVKAKLEAVESGVVTFDQEFYAHIVLPNGMTVYEQTGHDVERLIATGDTGTLAIEA